MKRFFLLLPLMFFGLFFGLSVHAENIFVEDQAGVLSEETKEKIYQYNQQYQTLELRPQLAVVTLDSLPSDQSIESYANEKFNQLGIGNKEHDSGILYVVAVNDRKQRIEVGYGLEGDIPDALAMDLMTDEVKDYLRAEDYDAAVALVASNIHAILAEGKTIKDFKPRFAFSLFIQTYGFKIFIFLCIFSSFFSMQIKKTYIYCNTRWKYGRDLRHELRNSKTKYRYYSAVFLIRNKSHDVMKAKGELEDRYRYGLWQTPAYYDFAFAFGGLTFFDFLAMGLDEIEDYSMYRHYHQLLSRSSRYDSGSGGSGGSSGGSSSDGGSFGGGSSGGGGASSDW